MSAVRVPTIVLILAALGSVITASAQEAQIAPGSERPMFTTLTPTLHSPRTRIEAASVALQTWNGSFTYNGTTYTYNMVGAAPSTNSSATITTGYTEHRSFADFRSNHHLRSGRNHRGDNAIH